MTDFRKPAYLSPSALSLWEGRTDEAFERYIVSKDIRPPRTPQADFMSVGSAFDALVKSDLAYEFWTGPQIFRRQFGLANLVEKQCEPHTLPESLEVAMQLYQQYKDCGAYANLVESIGQSDNGCNMEFDVTSTIGGVPLLGKPDLWFNTPNCSPVITDWKVSGSMSKCGVSPQQGYMLALDTRNTNTNGKAHKKFEPVQHVGGVLVNGWKMNESTDYWADQLSTYGWCKGFSVGSEDWIARIEQIAVRPGLKAKCVTHQSTVDTAYQGALLERYQKVWSHVQSGHYFHYLTRAQSDARANLLVIKLTQPVAPVDASLGSFPTFNWSN